MGGHPLRFFSSLLLFQIQVPPSPPPRPPAFPFCGVAHSPWPFLRCCGDFCLWCGLRSGWRSPGKWLWNADVISYTYRECLQAEIVSWFLGCWANHSCLETVSFISCLGRGRGGGEEKLNNVPLMWQCLLKPGFAPSAFPLDPALIPLKREGPCLVLLPLRCEGLYVEFSLEPLGE